MKLLWNSLLISFGILLPTSTSIVLAKSPKPTASATLAASTSEPALISASAALVLDGTLPTPGSQVQAMRPALNETHHPQMTPVLVESVVAQEVSPAAKPPATIVVPVTTETRPTGTTGDSSPDGVRTIVIPDATPASTPSAPTDKDTETPTQTDAPEKTPTTTTPNSEDSTEAKELELTPEELARQQKLIEADQLYMSGKLAEAQQLYREAKEPFATEAQAKEKPEPIYDPAKLPAAGSVYWRISGEGLEQKLETKIMVPLESLSQQYPEFIPGHLRYARALKEYGQSEKALEVLERATTLYPAEPDLLKAKIVALDEREKWLEASLAARQFALLYPDHPQRSEFATLADENLERYRRHVRRKVRGNAIANAITGALGLVLTGNLFGPISAIDSTVMLLRGESAVGESAAKHVKRFLPLTEDEQVLNYVREVGNKLAIVAGRNDFQYEFYVVMDDKINAFALPGGKVFVNAGAIVHTNSEAELAGLLAHELSHAVLSHGFQIATQGNLTANVTQYIPYGGILGDLAILNYSRDMERQADALGTRILASSGYAADGMRNLMVTLDKEERDRPILAWLSSHPDTKQRISNIETLIDRNGYNRYTYEGVARHLEIQKRVAQLLKEYKERKNKKE